MLVRVGIDVLTRNNVTASGRADGQPIVFAHGYGCDQNMWRFVAPAFKGQNRAIVFDFVGAGGSDLSAYGLRRYGSLDG
jgi:sigma-B regulation protein RsbQ